jgi:hypothetical protein
MEMIVLDTLGKLYHDGHGIVGLEQVKCPRCGSSASRHLPNPCAGGHRRSSQAATAVSGPAKRWGSSSSPPPSHQFNTYSAPWRRTMPLKISR